MANSNLSQAKRAKNDEFYTQWADIEKEINAYLEFNPDVFRGKTILCPCDDPEWSNFTKYFALHFQEFGLKKFISTSYAAEAKNIAANYQPTLFETLDPKFNEEKTNTKGKIYVLDQNEDLNSDGKIDIEDLCWDYMEGDGDFRSFEVRALRDEADIIITNPPFSLFREFMGWVMDGQKQFLVIGNKNAITYKEIFPLIMENKVWVGASGFSKDILFAPHNSADLSQLPSTAVRVVDGVTLLRSPSIWFTNIDHGRRHQPLPLMTMADNLKFSKHKELKGKKAYDKYDNYDAIEVPFTDAIPSDYDGVMGVPISFLDKYCPEQFEIVAFRKGDDGKDLVYTVADIENEREAQERERCRFAPESSAILQNTHTSPVPNQKSGLPTNSEQPEQSTQAERSTGAMKVESIKQSRPTTGFLYKVYDGLITGAGGGMINGKSTYKRLLIRKVKQNDK